MIWNPETKVQHFIRQASFKSDGADLGFIVPTPAEPELAASGNDAFDALGEFTKPEVQYRQARRQATGCGCASESKSERKTTKTVEVLQQKRVAGYDATVLEATSADDLAKWLAEHGYDFSPQIATWAEPYVADGWKFTALRVAKEEEQKDVPQVSAEALRITFKTDQPLFPYREPDMTIDAEKLNAKRRLLRIYFLADKRYGGELTKVQTPWNGYAAWSDRLNEEQCKSLQEKLALPDEDLPTTWWLTEFEHLWPYEPAPGDVYFSASTDQSVVHRPPVIIETASNGPVDAMPLVIAVVLVAPVLGSRLCQRLRRRA